MKLLSAKLKNSLELSLTIVHSCHLLITIVTMSFILDAAADLDPQLYVNTLCNFVQALQALQILNNLY